MKSLVFVVLCFLLFGQISSQPFFTLESNLTQPSSYYFGWVLVGKGNHLLIDDGRRNTVSLYSVAMNGSVTFVNSFPEFTATAFYGLAIDVDSRGSVVVVGDFGYNSKQGAAYIFSLNGTTWSSQQVFASDGVIGDEFGYAVAVDNGIVVVGAPLKSGASGAIYVFTNNGTFWNQVNELSSPLGGQFGYSLLLVGTLLVASSPNNGPGYVTVYTVSGTTWNSQNLTNNNVVSGSQFGTSISFDGTTLAISAPGDSVNNVTGVGTISLFVSNGGVWTLQTEVYPTSNYTTGQNAGKVISIYGNLLVMSNPAFVYTTSNPGSVYSFIKSGSNWTQNQIISSPTGSISFSQGLLLYMNTLYVGDPRGVLGGIVFIYNSPVIMITTAIQTTVIQTTAMQMTGSQITGSQITGSQITGSQTTSSSINISSKIVPSLFFLFFILVFLF